MPAAGNNRLNAVNELAGIVEEQPIRNHHHHHHHLHANDNDNNNTEEHKDNKNHMVGVV
ncbi:unnamed protein product, partial [marine sediment metagenome]